MNCHLSICWCDV